MGLKDAVSPTAVRGTLGWVRRCSQMDRHRNPNRAMRNIGLAAIGALATTCAGLLASRSTISSINPIYFNNPESREPRPLPDRTELTDVTYAPNPSFPSIPGDQYYYDRSSPAPASYDAAPSLDTDIVSPPTEPDRLIGDRATDQEGTDEEAAEPNDGDTSATKNSPREEPGIPSQSESASNPAEAEDDTAVLLPPPHQLNY